MNVPDWLHNEILTGLQKLVCLNRPNTPALDMIGGTALAWGEALAFRRQWDQARDVPRLRDGFSRLLGTISEWPGPHELLDAMPSSMTNSLPRLPAPELTEAEKRERRAHAARLIAEANRRADAEIARERRA